MGLGRHQNAICRRKLDAPADWEAFQAEVLSDGSGVLYQGSIARQKTRGPHKGQLVWGPKSTRIVQKVVITDDEVREEMRRYESETGNCSVCFGEKEISGWAKETGRKTKLCNRCNGTGKVPARGKS